MTPLPGMNDPAIGTLILLLVFGFCFIVAVLAIMRRARRSRNPMHLTDEQFLMDWDAPRLRWITKTPNWKWWGSGMFTGLALLVLLGFTAERDDQVRLAATLPIAKPRPPQIVTLADCPKPGPGLTDTVVMVIRSQADLKPAVTGCSRIAERSFVLRKKPIVADAK